MKNCRLAQIMITMLLDFILCFNIKIKSSLIKIFSQKKKEIYGNFFSLQINCKYQLYTKSKRYFLLARSNNTYSFLNNNYYSNTLKKKDRTEIFQA